MNWLIQSQWQNSSNFLSKEACFGEMTTRPSKGKDVAREPKPKSSQFQKQSPHIQQMFSVQRPAYGKEVSSKESSQFPLTILPTTQGNQRKGSLPKLRWLRMKQRWRGIIRSLHRSHASIECIAASSGRDIWENNLTRGRTGRSKGFYQREWEGQKKRKGCRKRGSQRKGTIREKGATCRRKV